MSTIVRMVMEAGLRGGRHFHVASVAFVQDLFWQKVMS